MISIIIPVYNAAKYLNQCLASIAVQSYIDWECIIIDDGSNDESQEICQSWLKKDSRFILLNQANQGVSVARNNGVKVAQGKYLTFIDSDDWIDKDYLKTLFENIHDADLVISGFKSEYEDDSNEEIKPSYNGVFRIGTDCLENFVDLNRKFLLYVPHEKLYRRDLIEHYKIRFPIGCSFGEDLQFNYKYLDCTTNISQVAEAYYHYRIVKKGNLSNLFRPNQFEQDYAQWKILKDFYVRHDMWLKPAKELLYKRLWGIVYDGIYSSKTCNKQILSIPEISDLKSYQHVFLCAKWIKFCILHRITLFFPKK